ncbi:MAG: histone deacetylase [Desulfarculaceae bacterium]|nr:histone deacetylase [Desulfarculaceae bacterium]MCF8071755.1 histone deacetylase [Desulfarculaceae bacterium]MCF8101305.1 histone deacetylase [Desulfarculaceae bacterium]MCF8117264.1 histone deacetylase [Desulfarculaceae bacterium]
MPLGVVRDPVFREHDTGPYHCEVGDRLAAIDQAIEQWEGRDCLEALPLRPATEEELKRVHHPSHLSRIASTAGRAMDLDPDTICSPRSHEIALLAAGSLIDLCDAALSGEVDHGFALVRPPGHHATTTRAMGFCLYNNIAAAAAHLITQRGLNRVLIVDWDVHHGNGTEDIFYAEPRVTYFSTHQSPLYPGTGQVGAVGHGAGQGRNLNVPLSPGRGDVEHLAAFHHILAPVAQSLMPEFILVSAGFDAHREDPLGSMMIDSKGFAALTQVLVELSREFCPGKVVMALEGGYNQAALGRAVVAVLRALNGSREDELIDQAAGADMPAEVERAMQTAGNFWRLA